MTPAIWDFGSRLIISRPVVAVARYSFGGIFAGSQFPNLWSMTILLPRLSLLGLQEIRFFSQILQSFEGKQTCRTSGESVHNGQNDLKSSTAAFTFQFAARINLVRSFSSKIFLNTFRSLSFSIISLNSSKYFGLKDCISPK